MPRTFGSRFAIGTEEFVAALPRCHAALSSREVMFQSGRHLLVTAHVSPRMCRRERLC